jgi:hypothetical protein
MPRKNRVRLWTTAAVALVAAVVVVLAYPLLASSEESGGLNVSGQASTENCTPCHATAGASRNPAVIFDHAAHLLVDCTACHITPAHSGGGSATPPMTTCFACHGLLHGPTGLLASGTCADCHPPTFNRRPLSHVEDWKEKPHAEVAKASGVNGCLLCHSAPQDCDLCHAEQDVGVGPMPSLYLNTLPKVTSEPPITVNPAEPVTISQCVYCHPNVDGFSVTGLVFGHDAHLQRAYRCEACHKAFPHDAAGTKRLPMRDCMRCHGLEHNGSGQVASTECLKCHTADFPLEPNDHTIPFLSGEHKTPALNDSAYCSQCHLPESCVTCHNGGVELADGTMGKPVIPKDHRRAEWGEEHGPQYLQQKGLCVVCHTSESCQQCHQTTMPHPATWLADHTKAKGELASDCNVCHKDREYCQDCHHNSVRSAQLVKENCVGCHEEMATEPARDIKVPGLAEHAVHFQVALPEKKGKPYTCDECHIGFGNTGVQVLSPATGPHDMRVCYECHGSLDYQNVLIAPYAGAELCLRCHADLNIR